MWTGAGDRGRVGSRGADVARGWRAASTVSPMFDLDGDFYAEHTGWARPDDGILVRDLDGNGVIDDVTEMFGGVGRSGFPRRSMADP